MVFFEFGVAQGNGRFKIFGLDTSSYLFRVANCLHQGHAFNLILADSNDRRRCLGCHVQHRSDGFDALQSRKQAVIRASRAASLCVSQDRDTSVQTQSIGQDVLDGCTRDLVQIPILGSFGNNDDRAALSPLLTVLVVGIG